MRIKLNEQNTRNLLFVANLLEIEPEHLVNDWLLRDYPADLVNAGTGGLRALYETIEYDNPRMAKRVAVRLMSWERKQMGGKDHGLPDIKVG